MSTASAPGDKAGSAYWQEIWRREAPEPIDPGDAALDNHQNRRLYALFQALLPPAEGGLILEAGCGASQWLPVFARHLGWRVAGVDYSEKGCALAEAVLAKAGVRGDIRLTDLFAPPPDLAAVADVVYSMGLVEHFTPTSGVVERLGWLARPGGLVLTLVPNMRGLTGLAQRLLDPEVYALHVRLDPRALSLAHREAGLEPLAAGYFGTLNLSVANHDAWAARRPGLHALAARAKAWPTKLVWLAERALGGALPNRFTSPFAYCLARKPAEVPR